MTGSLCRRLLAAVLLIFFVKLLVPAQSTADRLSVAAPTLWDTPEQFGRGFRAPLLSPPLNPVLPRRSPLAQIAKPAGIIFSGRVIAVGRSDAPGGRDTDATFITFQVEQAIRGVTVGQELIIHEWAGLWARGERYRVGERVMLFLFPPSKLGLTSPVSGPWGRFEIDSAGRVVLNDFNAQVVEKTRSAGKKDVIPYPEFVRALRLAAEEE
jgi:hypothetical protein